ncbi:hypothetical protein BGX38DRAFT_689360 [Terfezia claveryi]|nr:hypothetical protein BGX38DRAFT_689360 [Terfezia claveryi]
MTPKRDRSPIPASMTKKLHSGHCTPITCSPLSTTILIWLLLFTTSRITTALPLPLPRPYDVIPGGIHYRPRPASAIGSGSLTPNTIGSSESVYDGRQSWWEGLSSMAAVEQLGVEGRREVEGEEDLGLIVEGDDSEGGSGAVSSRKEGGEKLLGWERWVLPWILGGVSEVVGSGGGGGAMLVHKDPVVQEKKKEKEEEKEEVLKGEIKKGDKIHGHATGVNRPEPQQLEVLKGEYSAGKKAHGHTHTIADVNHPEPHLHGQIAVPEGEAATQLVLPHAHPVQPGNINRPFPQRPSSLDPTIPLFPESQHGHSHPINLEDHTTKAPPYVLHDNGAKKTYHITPTAGHDFEPKPETNIGDVWKPLINQDELWTYPPSPLSAGMDPEKWPKSRLEPVSVLDKGNPLPGLRMWEEMREEEERRKSENRKAPLMLTFGEEKKTPMLAIEDGKGSGYQAEVESAAGISTPAITSPSPGGKTIPLSSSNSFLFRPPTPEGTSQPRTPIPWPDISPDHPTPPLIDPAHQRTWPNSPGLADADYENFPQSLIDPLSVVDAEDPLPSLRKWWEQKETEREWEEVNRETGRDGGGSSSHKSGKNSPLSPQPDPVFEENGEEGSWGSRSSWESTENNINNKNDDNARGGEGGRFKMSTSGSSSPVYPHPKSPGWQVFGGLVPGLKKNKQKEIIMMHKLGVPAKDKWGFVKWNLDSTEHGARLRNGVLEWGGELLGSLFGGRRRE